MKVTAIICAAGRGERAGFGKNKLLAPLHGAPALWHTLKKFDIDEVNEVIVAASERDFKEISALALPFGYRVIVGGETRTESVKKALEETSGDVVLIHDGARPYASRELIKRCIAGVKNSRSAVCATAATDTTVYCKGDTVQQLERSALRLVQTPQGFYTEDIRRAYALAGDRIYTDDSAIYAEFIAPPVFIEGERENKKLTYKSDFDSPPLPIDISGRAGFGIDVHAFGEGTHVTLGGVLIPCDGALIAHSDGDVLVHAIMDALLSAAGLNDIGHYFPDTDEKFRGASSLEMLKATVKLVKDAGYAPVNISASIQAEKPRLKNCVPQMRKNLSRILGVRTEDVAVAAGTSEGLGFVGEGLGITAYCIATVKEV